jgi:hypothetical protein
MVKGKKPKRKGKAKRVKRSSAENNVTIFAKNVKRIARDLEGKDKGKLIYEVQL